MTFLKRANHALASNPNYVNGANADIAITTRGSDFYFAICAAMTVATFSFLGLAFRKHRRDRIFHYITAGVTMVAAIAYFTMGSNLGFTPVAVEYKRGDHRVHGMFREIFYVRYIDWFITTPLLLMDLLLTAGMPWPTVLWVILVDEVMIVTGLIGALVQSSYKWGYFTFGCFALVYIVYQLVWEARRHSIALGADVSRAFFTCGTLTTVLWIIYPIAWGVCEGGNILAPDSEAVFYGILDFFAKPIFGALLIWGHRNIEPSRLGLAIRDYEDDASVGTTRHHGHHEKAAPTAAAAAGGVAATEGATHGHDHHHHHQNNEVPATNTTATNGVGSTAMPTTGTAAV